MALGKNSINAIGVVFSGAVLLGGLNFVVLPQLEVAEDYQQQTEQAVAENTTEAERLNELAAYQAGPQELEQQLLEMREQLPNSNSATDIQRAIVESLNSSVELISFSYEDSESFSAPEPPTVSLGESTPPFDIGEGDSAAGGDEEEEGGGSGAATGLTATPVEIRVSSNSSDSLSQFLNDLQAEGRLFLVARVDIADGEGSDKTAHVHAWALSNH